MIKKCLINALVCILLFFGLASSSFAQSIVTGGISGTVTDQTGAVVTGVKLTLVNPAIGATYSATSSASGEFNFALLKPGQYTLTVAKDGFKTATRTVTVVLGTTVTVNTALEVGSSATTVEVNADTGAQLQTENANISTSYEIKQIQEVPNPGGDITYVAQTAPGVTMNNATGGGYGNFSTFGLPATSNLFTVNGNDYNDPFLNLNNTGSSNLLLGGNELQEVSVTNNAYTGQYGRQAGSQVDYTTKSGTNSWHGDAVYNWTGRFLNANDPVNLATSPAGGPLNPRPFENNNQWAASLGGPIIKDKLFFFLNNEGIRYIFGSIHSASAPTPEFENYVLGNVPQDAATQAFYQNTFKLYNGAPNIANAVPTPGSCTAAGGWTPATLPAALSANTCTEAWTNSVSAGNKEWLLSARIDYKFSDTDQVFGRMKFDRGVQPTYTDSINPIFDTSSTQPQNEGQLNYTHIFSPTVVNNFIGSVLWYSALFGSVSANSPALSLFPGNLAFSDGSLTNIGFGSGNPGGFGQGFLFPQGRNVTQWGLVDDLSVTRGNHSFKMGVNFRRDDISDHTASELALYPAVQTTLLGFATDEVASSTQYNFATSPVQPVAFYTFGLYFQDEFRVNPNLKLTLTLRADRNSGGACQHACAGLPVNEFSDLAHGADIPYNQSFQTGLTTIIPGVEKVVFQPRFGVAWTPWGSKTVIRAGVGLFSDLYPGTILSGIDTNFPQVNLWNVPGGSLAWDLNSPATTAFPTSGVALVQQCNTAFNSNYFSGGNLNTYLATPGLPAGCATTPTLNDVSRNLSNPKYVEWNFEIQHALGTKAIVSANYVGNYGYDELYSNDYQNSFGFGDLPATAPDPRVGLVKFLTSGAVSNYNGLTLSIKANTWHGLTGSFTYTYSHALDEVSNAGILPFSVITSITNQINPYSLRDNYASADYDARHQLSASYIYALPFKSEHRLLNSAIGGWQLSGTMFYRTGFPFSVIDGGTLGGLAGNNLNPSFNTILLQPEFSRRNFSNVDSCVAAPCFGIAGTGSTAPYLFAPATNFTGDVVGRNAFRGPGFLGGDMSLRKNFQFTERVGFQIGLNAYNWFNHANYGAPYPNTNAPFFGQAVFTQTPPTSPYGAFAAAATDMRIAQITAKITF
ncbi:MAG TPA: carboxypeptidase regulatory-like domain-containing protein [Candidatus Acidoferrales bacterium]|nr:carboxypeptidase regulatory-like domain-containing protein [Candidatus Acidoferrales bacterium]